MLRSMMYVTTPSGWSRSRTASASIPSSSRSASRRSATPSSRESRSPASTFFPMRSDVPMEPQLGDLRDQAQSVRPPVELLEPGQLVLAQAVRDVGPQVRFVAGAVPGPGAIIGPGDVGEGGQARAKRVLEALDVAVGRDAG